MHWNDSSGPHSYAVFIDEVLRNATGGDGEALVIDLRPRGVVKAYLEQSRP